MAIISNTVQNNGGNSSSVTPGSRVYRNGGTTVRLQEGQMLKGVVSDVHGNQITLSMDDGTSFTGKLPDASLYSIGQKAAFQIASLTDNTIYLKAVTGAYLLDMEDTIEQALEEANLPKTDRNLDVVRSLLKNQQSISRDNILSSIRLCAQYPDADVDAVITMRRLSVPLTLHSVEQFEKYQNQTHQLLYKMDALTDSVGDMAESIGKQVPRLAKEVGARLITMALEGSPSLEETALSEGHVHGNSSADGGIRGAAPAPVYDSQGNTIPLESLAKGTVQSAFYENGSPVPADSLREIAGTARAAISGETAMAGTDTAEGTAAGASTGAPTDGSGTAGSAADSLPAVYDSRGRAIPPETLAAGTVKTAFDQNGKPIPTASLRQLAETARTVISGQAPGAYAGGNDASGSLPVIFDARGNAIPPEMLAEGKIQIAFGRDGSLIPANLLEQYAETAKTVLSTVTENSQTASAGNAPQDEQQMPPSGSSSYAQEKSGPLSAFSKMRQLFTSLTDSNSAVKTAITKSGLADDYRTPFIHEQTGFILPPAERGKFAAQLSEYPLAQDIRGGIADGSVTARNFLSEILKKLPEMTEEQAGKLLASKPFRAIIKGQLMSGWTISPEQLREEQSMDKLYGKMAQQFEALAKFSENTFGKDVFSQVSGQAQDMNDNLNFMRTLNETFQYIQLPLKLQNQTAHGDLYVMTRKEALKKGKKNLKALLHLDMDALGTLDIQIEKDNTAVSAHFYVSSQATKDLLETNMGLLSNAIAMQGYDFNPQLSMKEKKVDIVKDFLAADAPAPDFKRYNFDLRA